jgi:tryptophan halogenase
MTPLRIAVAGDGVAAWMAAAALASALGSERGAVQVVSTGTQDVPAEPFGLADTTLPWLSARQIRMPDPGDTQIARAGGSFSFGIALSGWNGPGETWFHPFGSIGAPLGPVAFHQLAQKLRADGEAVRFANFSMAALAAQAGRFQRPGSDPGSVLSTCAAAYHMDLDALAGLYREQAGRAGVRSADGALTRVERTPEGAIDHLATTEGERIDADLFIDATGVAARLAGDAEADWVDWTAWLPADQVLSARITDTQPPLPFSHAEATTSGWRRFVPLQGGGVLDQVGVSSLADTDELARVVGDVAEIHRAPLHSGRRARAWRHNCLAIGSAATRIDPVAVSNLQLLRSGVDRLLALLPASADADAERAEYNRRFAAECDNARDYAAAHYALNGRRGEAFWDERRGVALPDSLAYRLELYAATGRVALYDDEPLEESAWLCLFDECGVRPARVHPMAAGVAAADARRHAERIRAVMIETLRAMPLHAETLAALRSGRN